MERSSRTSLIRRVLPIGFMIAVATILPLATCAFGVQDPQKKSKATGSAAKTKTAPNPKPPDPTPTKPAEPPAGTPKTDANPKPAEPTPAAPLSLDAAIKAAGSSSKDIADSVKLASEALDQASAPGSDAPTVKTAIAKASDAIKAIAKAQATLGDALDAATKAATKPSEPTPVPFPDPNFIPGSYQLGDLQIGFFAVPFAGSFDEYTITAAGKKGRRIVELGETLGKQKVLNRVALKDGDKAYPNVAFGFHVRNEAMPRFMAIGGTEADLLVYQGGGAPIIKDEPGLTQTASFPIAGLGNVKLTATLRGDFAELIYELPGKPDQIQLVGKYDPATAKAGSEQFQFSAILVRGAGLAGLAESHLEAARKIGQEITRSRGISLSTARHGITFLPGDGLMIVAASVDQGIEARCLLTAGNAGEILVLARAATDSDTPFSFGGKKPEHCPGFIKLQLADNVAIPVKIDSRANYGLDFTIQWPR